MTSSIDTNVLVALMDSRAEVTTAAKELIVAAAANGELMIVGCVFAELMAGPQRTAADVERCLQREKICVEWDLGEPAWRLSGERYKEHCTRRRERGSPEQGSRRILADFLIGAHASVNGFELVTFDQRLFRIAFPEVILRSGLL
jgi:predicted nucleic acid-binding protein